MSGGIKNLRLLVFDDCAAIYKLYKLIKIINNYEKADPDPERPPVHG